MERACLLDFQLSRYAPPMLDLLYFLYVCTVRSMRSEHLDDLLRFYHGQLSATLHSLGCDADELYAWEDMQAQLQEVGRYGFGVALMTIPLFLADNDEIPDMDAKFEEGSDIAEVFTVDSKNAPERDKRISDVLQEMMDRGWM